MKLLALSELKEEFTYLDRLKEVVRNARIDGVLFSGSVLRAEARLAEWRSAQAEGRTPRWDLPSIEKERSDDAQSITRFLRSLNDLQVPVFLVPGRNDAPERFFLQAALNSEIVEPRVHLVHRSFAPLGAGYVVAGFGGEITASERQSEGFLRFPAWEAEFGLDFLRHLEQEKILLTYTGPAESPEETHSGNGPAAITHILKTYAPQFAVCTRPSGEKGKITVANTLVVFPGELARGDYAIIDTKERKVEFGDLR